MQLATKVILITGGCTGIGRAIAKKCVAEGARVVINGLEKTEGHILQNELGEDQTVLLIGDITEPHVPKKLVDLALNTFGRLDAVVNNAAMIVAATLETTDVPLFERMLAVNTVAPFAIIKAALPYLKQNKGCVLNIGSVNAWCGEPELLPYSVSKGALQTLTRNLGDALFRTHGVRVNQINPGWVLTEKEIQNKREQGLKEHWYEDLPLLYAPSGRLFLPEEIAAAAVFLLSNACGPVSGQILELEQYPFMGRNPSKAHLIH
ncbi:SDR family NAD(P)-dependent oxidoreductase [Arundinibacter roseus]|uniref:SDR family oxidoreductase n=1 Tax=Arundinibacter roseus TaxID=2070510 RepID=A0A4R4KDY8_9BACT|nr:SDR family oxidoreductase [Arundinibacter roseus]TDB64639.1 SDR family oxidoreductase [Arundinibacter roseus]